jgi:hypothetical protein
MSHLTPEQLIDFLEEESPVDPQLSAHLDVCEACRVRRDELAATLAIVRSDEAPNPSPLFWDHFPTRVLASVDSPTSSQRSPAWATWAVSAAAAALVAAIVLGGALNRGGAPDPPMIEVASGPTPADDPAFDASFEFIADLASDMDWDAADAAGLVAPGASEQAVLFLTAEEVRELERLLNAALAKSPVG